MQVMRQAGRLVEAQSLAQEALALLQSQLGSEHPRVAAQLMMLGQLAAQQGKQAVAEQNYRKALQVYQTVSGLHHPDTFNCLTSLVSLLRGAGKASHALPLAQRCLAVKKKSLGELHPDTAASMQVVADVMLDLGRLVAVAVVIICSLLQCTEHLMACVMCRSVFSSNIHGCMICSGMLRWSQTAAVPSGSTSSSTSPPTANQL